MTKAHIVSQIVKKTGIHRVDALHTVEAFFSVVKDSMENGQHVYIRGFGSFINKKRKRKIARNISRNVAIVIEEHFVPSFKPSKTFVSRIKNSRKVREKNQD